MSVDKQTLAQLESALRSQGLELKTDTRSFVPRFYVPGPNDLARLVLEIHPSSLEACQSMYQGNWGEDMPPRVAVIPVEEDSSAEMLKQMGIVVVTYSIDGERVLFTGLEVLLGE